MFYAYIMCMVYIHISVLSLHILFYNLLFSLKIISLNIVLYKCTYINFLKIIFNNLEVFHCAHVQICVTTSLFEWGILFMQSDGRQKGLVIRNRIIYNISKLSLDYKSWTIVQE